MRRRLVPLCLAALAVACTARDATPARPVVALVMKSLANEFFKTMEDGARRHQAANAVAVRTGRHRDQGRAGCLAPDRPGRADDRAARAGDCPGAGRLQGAGRRHPARGGCRHRRGQHRQSSRPRRDGRAPAQRAVCGPRQPRRRPRRRPASSPRASRPATRLPFSKARPTRLTASSARADFRTRPARPACRSSDRRPPTGKRLEPARSSRRW